MKSLAILGAGGHAKVIADAALCSRWQQVTFFDDNWPQNNTIGPWKISGNTESLITQLSEFDGVIIAIGNNVIRLEKIAHFMKESIPLATVIHPSAVVSRYAVVAQGSVVFANAVINPDSHIGLGAIINTGATVDHDCILGDAVHVSPGANLAGGVCVGDLSWIGIGSAVKQRVKIGNKVIVGAGAVVVNDIPDDCTVVGIPAKILSSKSE